MSGGLHPSLADASTTPFWLDSPERPDPRPPYDVNGTADLCVVGGGFSGLWTAILAKERDPDREARRSRSVVLRGEVAVHRMRRSRSGRPVAPAATASELEQMIGVDVEVDGAEVDAAHCFALREFHDLQFLGGELLFPVLVVLHWIAASLALTQALGRPLTFVSTG